CQSYLTSPFIF
nr:immunoglobulin light chain junction region [Macaca mulatta]